MKPTHYEVPPAGRLSDEDDDIELSALLAPIGRRWKAMLVAACVAGATGAAASYLVTPKFTAVNVFLPPQQQQSSAASALASLGALSALAGGTSPKGSPDEYIALMQSATVSDRIISRFDLKTLWDEKYQVLARKRLSKQVSITVGKKDGLMQVDVTDPDPARAAAMANQYVDELRYLTKTIAVTEAQQRRVFFESLLQQTRDKLGAAQTALEASGYTAGALKAQPASAAQAYAQIRAELTAAQVKLQVLRSGLADGSPEVQSQLQTVDALASQLAKLEAQQGSSAGSSDYVNRYREFKYEETLFDLFARQYENARVDESREGALIQVVDSATPPELKSSPQRSLFGLIGALIGLVAMGAFIVVKDRKPASELA